MEECLKSLMRILALFLLIMVGAIIVSVNVAAAQSALEMQQELSKFTREVGKLTKIKSDVTNNTTETLSFAFIVQIKDSDGVTVQLSWMEGVKVAPREKIGVMQSWIPEEAGEYLVEIFVWESIANPDPMSPVRKAVAIVEA